MNKKKQTDRQKIGKTNDNQQKAPPAQAVPTAPVRVSTAKAIPESSQAMVNPAHLRAL